MLVSVVYNPDESVYNSAPLPLNAQRNFLEGAGEGLPFHAVHLQLEGVIKVEGTLTRLVDLVYLNSCSLNLVIWAVYLQGWILSCSRPKTRQRSNKCRGQSEKMIMNKKM